MDTFEEMISAVQSDLTVGTESAFYSEPTIKLAINRAHRKSTALFRWPELRDAKKTTTQADREYYTYPQNWRPNSIWKLKVNHVDFGDPITFADYLYEQENDNPSGLERMWANNGKRYFFDPVPTVYGQQICVWGQKNATPLVEDTDTTIFSYSSPECNEAIVLEAVAILKSKGEEEAQGQFRSAEAKQILVVAWNKVEQEEAKHEKTRPMFDVPDYFGRFRSNTRKGNFS